MGLNLRTGRRKLLGAALAVTTGISIISLADAPAQANDSCVAPSAAVVSVQHVQGHPDTYTAKLKQPGTKTCSDWHFNVSSYTIPDSWDHNGWNQSILPQILFANTPAVFPAGQQEPLTYTVAVPTCGSYQTDAYTGPVLQKLEWPAPMHGVRLDGTIHAVPVSDNCTTPPPPHVTPPVKKATGHVNSGCQNHKNVVWFVLDNRKSKNGTHRSATATYRGDLSKKTWAQAFQRRVRAGHKVVTHRRVVPRGTKATLRVNGHLLDHLKVNKVCKQPQPPSPTPPSTPPHTGEKVVSGKA